MFRKLANLMVAFLLLILTTGFSISKHYCGSTLVSIAVDKEAHSCCDMNDGCCHTETHLFQLKGNYFSSHHQEITQPVQISLLFPITILEELTIPVQFTEPVFDFYSSPPPRSVSSVLSKLQTYRC